jgi:hypothetical protein
MLLRAASSLREKQPPTAATGPTGYANHYVTGQRPRTVPSSRMSAGEWKAESRRLHLSHFIIDGVRTLDEECRTAVLPHLNIQPHEGSGVDAQQEDERLAVGLP